MSAPRRILGISDSKSVFVPSYKDPLLFELIRAKTLIPENNVPTICYIGAAKGDRPERTADFFKLAERVGFQPSSLDLYAMNTGDSQAYFQSTDAIFIDGGVTRNLIALLKEWNVIEALRQAYQGGTLIAGASAGISMLFDWCISDSIKTSIQPVQGIGLLKGAVCAHYDALEARRITLDNLMRAEPTAFPAFGVEDGVAVLFENEVFVEAFTIRPNAKLHMFDKNDESIAHRCAPGHRLDRSSFSNSR